MTKQRADRLLVARGLFESRARAQAAIAAGRVTVDGVRLRKAAEEISPTAVIAAQPEHPYVSRGGVKLAFALDHFAVDVKDRVCLDVGASTGGFAEVLLQRGARRVYAVDVGRQQLHSRLRGRGDLVSIEQTDVRALDPSSLAEPPDLATVDVSFISLRLVVPAIEKLLKLRASLLALIKPQFEAGRGEVKKGVVRDASVQAAICAQIGAFLAARGWRVGGIVPSPIPGGEGNREFFVGAERG
ncbi:MAG: TlyA family RNA methyltransferase [Acetobacteraceae bacterium]|nr:TlyA family RNA methyltransferase [Acetobacteraceae bacterium]